MLGERGVADAAKGNEEQAKEVQNWIDSMWPVLAKAIAEEPLTAEKILKEARNFVLKETDS